MMKTLIYFVAFSMLVLISGCGGSATKSEQQTTGDETVVTEEMTETENEAQEEAVGKEETEINNCDEFLEKYENWVDDYLDLLEKFKKNPADPDLTRQYVTVTNELAGWSQQWFKFIDCNDQEEYEQRFEAISDKVDKKLKELGYE